MKKMLLGVVLVLLYTCGSINAAILGDWEAKTLNAEFDVRDSIGSVYFNNKMWVIGGGDEETGFKDVWNSSDGVTWAQVTADAGVTSTLGSSILVHDNKIWIIGGDSEAAVWYSTNGADWTAATLNAEFGIKEYATTLSYNNKLWIIAGIVGENRSKDVWNSSDGVTWTQVTADAGFVGRDATSGLVFDNKMWIIAGYTDLSPIAKDVWYSTNGADWTAATLNAEFGSRWGHSSKVYNDKMWVIGGNNDITGLSDVWYSTDGITWTKDTELQFPIRESFGLITDGVGLYVIAGRSELVYLNDVWYAELMSTPTATYTNTVTHTPTPTYTPTPINTSTLQEVRNAKWIAYTYDIMGNTINAVPNYYISATKSASRNLHEWEAWMIYSSAHTLIKKFRASVNWNNKKKYMIYTPTYNATQEIIFKMTATPVMYLLSEADSYLNIVQTLQVTPVSNKVKVDKDFISVIQTFVIE